MKRLVLFKGGVETLEFFTEQMSLVWQNMGYDIFWCSLILQSEGAKELIDFCELHKGEELTLFTMNFEGIAGEEGYYTNDCCIWDKYNFKVVNVVVDHPLYYHKFIKNHPRRYFQINIDKDHVVYMNRFFKGVDVMYMMSAGTELNENRDIIPDKPYLPIKDRPIDVIFTGNYTPKEKLKVHLENMESDYIDFYEEICSYLIDNPDISIESAAEQFLKREFPDITDEQLLECMPNMMYVDLSVRFHYREKVIKMLADNGVVIHTFGDGYDYIKCENPQNIIKHGSVDSETCLRFISQAKISLNVMPWFKRGVHDRVFNSMLNGAVCLTDSSKELDNLIKDEENALIYELNDTKSEIKSKLNADKILDFFADSDKLQEIADNAYKMCAGKNTWKKNAEIIAGIFDKDF